MSDSLTLTIIIVAVVAVVGIGVIAFVTKGRKPKTPYTSERDADDLPAGQAAEGTTEAVADAAGATDAAVAVEEPVVPATPQLDVPEPVQGRLARLRARLTKSNNMFSKGLLALLSQDTIDEDVWEEIEENLLMADLGTEPAMELVDALRERVKIEGSKDPARVKAMLREELLKLVDPSLDRSYLPEPHPDRPSIIMVVGVNGVGKTTTIGKMARVLVAEDKDVLLGAADTFRAAAAEQLATWGDRVGVPTVRSDIDGADPASVAFEAVSAGIDQEVDIVMIDTAGRLQNKVGLMDELGKIKRVVEKKATIDEVLLVLDATTGQNGLQQAKVFSEVVNVTGIVLTKLDGTAKGGIVVAIQRQLGVPVKLVGLGEGPDDLAPFSPEDFVDALLEG
ncbi:signal recognition particle-docking protein FtsY [Glutamicibacter halophytocola]|uniref:Signal recognition particle receptor FtsY n=1 Tax=Glutamicibacter halophytocola TaxID=1933880 RepID=A0ABX5Y5H2_9MICC|nr:signal recognition particle-docking protein FtsY [Glutamicibacter halophytocola]MBF6671469.1 signal recognition particle-docking protein FtsY [Glutamicibacter sp. FBE19]QDY65121.1 signal recognition particle-docking protein FtsY [Glutamicibacter halophytocola]